jgi:hypothetical protein
MSDDWSVAPADGMLAVHCRPNGKFGTSVQRAASDKNTLLVTAEEEPNQIRERETAKKD